MNAFCIAMQNKAMKKVKSPTKATSEFNKSNKLLISMADLYHLANSNHKASEDYKDAARTGLFITSTKIKYNQDSVSIMNYCGSKVVKPSSRDTILPFYSKSIWGVQPFYS